MAEIPVLFHIGYHNTGTTWLQERLFQPASSNRQRLELCAPWLELPGYEL